jgi:hypothetical protein
LERFFHEGLPMYAADAYPVPSTDSETDMKPKQIQELRHALGENTETFGARFAASARTVEGWEQGRRSPAPLVQRLLTELWDAHVGKGQKRTPRKKA